MAEKLDHWCDINWLIFLCVTAAVTAVLTAIFWEEMPLGAKGAAFAAIIMAFHVLEEWKFPGGLHYFYNIFFVHRDPRHPDQKDLMRYPMSRLTDMITNICLQWIPLIYLVLTLIFPSLSNGVTIAMILFLISVPLTETPIKKWVIKQKDGMFAFAGPKYFTKYVEKQQGDK